MKTKKAVQKPLTPEQVLNCGQKTAKRIAFMLGEFLKETGQIISAVHIESVGTPQENGRIEIMQSVRLDYGVPQIQTPAPAPVEFAGVKR